MRRCPTCPTLRGPTARPLAALALPLMIALGACTAPEQRQIVTSPVTDPYTTNASGVAVYKSNLNRPGTRLPGTPAPITAADFKAVGDSVQFAAGDAALSPEARTRLRAQAEWLAQNEGWNALVEGHADDPGPREYNLALGARRASAVEEYLVANGVPQSRLSTISYGRERPLDACESEACRALNRRVVTVVSPAAGV